MVEKYSLDYNGNNYITKHFKVKEFASINGKVVYSDVVLIDTLITEILEKLFVKMKADKIVITSGYRTPAHEKNVGNKSGTGYHVQGMAVDINVWKNSNTRFTAKEIVLALDDLGWNHGIGYITNTAVHIDSRDSKYWFDERYSCKSIKSIRGSNDWYEYFGVKRVEDDLTKAIKELAKRKIINETFWLNNYFTDTGKACIPDLIKAFYKYLP